MKLCKQTSMAHETGGQKIDVATLAGMGLNKDKLKQYRAGLGALDEYKNCRSNFKEFYKMLVEDLQ